MLPKKRLEAEKDCTLSLKLDNTYVKAYQRRAAAREALKKFEEAEYDTLKVLELEPKNKESRITLERIKKQLGRAEKPPEQRPISKFTISRNGTMPSNKATATSFISTLKTDTTYLKKDVDTVKPVSIWPEQNDIILVKPINKPPHLRIEITEVDGTKSETDITKLSEATDAIKKHVFEKRPVEQVLETPTKTFFNMKRSERNLDNLEHPTALPQPKQEVTCIRSDDLKIIEKNPPKEKRSDLNKNIVENKVLTSYNTTNNNFIVPQTSLQFCLTWKKLKNMEEKYKYLKCVPPHNLPQIFLASLENDIFSSILEVLVKHFIDNKDYVFDILDNLTRVKRFGALAAFMSTEDKANLWKLYDYMKQTEQKDMKELDKLKTKGVSSTYHIVNWS
ncbi:hypothetical protein NQ317_013349 [Molorchus minor]|uniref:RNA-polymerase II-associated protein 3-like C-terminal domain-containing protein n=1 Tax=Molorchus minor TaxID=1323400 RepID=A0ABQ9IU40_9CUCU|nr:hypothetical protein NQ317_013349 [Molorchus minor]